MFDSLTTFLPINGIELAFAFLFLALSAVAMFLMGATVQRVALLTILLSAPVLVSAERDTQFMTVDEKAISDLMLKPQDRAQSQMVAGAFRTTLPAALHAVRAMESAQVSEDHIRMALKGAHWLIGAMLIFAIYIMLAKLGDFDAFDPPFFIISTSCLFLLPVTSMAIKTLNYDSISMLGSVLALLLVCFALSNHSRTKLSVCLAAIVVATLAAQEKLSASPILVVVLIAYALLWAQRARNYPIVAAIVAVVTGVCISASLSVLSTAVYALGYPGSLPPALWTGIGDAFSTWAWIPLQILSGKGGGEAPDRLAAMGLAISCLVIAAAVVGTCAGARPHVLRFGPRIVAFAVLAGLAAGLLSMAVLQPFWAPFYPSTLAKSYVMNGIWLHFGLDSELLTRVAYIGYAFEIIVVSLPTFVFGLVVVACLLMIVRRGAEDNHASFLILVALALTLMGALLQIPLGPRYLNIPLMLLMLAALLLVFGRLRSIRRAATGSVFSLLIACACALSVVLEVLPFRPLFAAYRPYWVEYPDAHFAEPGRMNPSWVGWGEEKALLGAEFEKWCATEGGGCNGVHVYHMYDGRWLPERPRPFTIERWSDVMDKEPLGSTDFYLFSRTVVVQGIPQPKSKPIVTLAFRGYEMAWIYRGSDLAREGYRFGRP